jgi:hypothetical protein
MTGRLEMIKKYCDYSNYCFYHDHPTLKEYYRGCDLVVFAQDAKGNLKPFRIRSQRMGELFQGIQKKMKRKNTTSSDRKHSTAWEVLPPGRIHCNQQKMKKTFSDIQRAQN